MNFVAHGSNKISKQLLIEFFVRLLLRHKEPLVLMVSSDSSVSVSCALYRVQYGINSTSNKQWQGY